MPFVGFVSGETLLIKVGDGGTPETFNHPCLINTDRAFEMSADASVTAIADCASPSAPAKTVRQVKSVDTKISGAGKLDATSVKSFLDWLASGAAKNIKVVQNLAGSAGGWTATGSFVLTSFQASGARGEKQDCSITLEQADLVTFTTNAG